MTSTRLLSYELQQKIRSVSVTLNALNTKESKQIIRILQKESGITAPMIAKHSNFSVNIVNRHLSSLIKAKVLFITEENDQAFFSLNYERLSKISSVVHRLSQ